MNHGAVVAIHLSDGGVPKLPVAQALVTAVGLEGDRQNDLNHHGGPERALCLYSLERIEALRAEGHPIRPGATGENLTISGLDWEGMAPGVKLAIGEVQLEITSYTTPCKKIGDSFAGGESMRVSQERHPGWGRVYARVSAGGVIRAGDQIAIVDDRE